jgi:hypothetical protein
MKDIILGYLEPFVQAAVVIVAALATIFILTFLAAIAGWMIDFWFRALNI